MRKSQKGFAVLEGLLILVVLCIITFGTWHILATRRSQANSSSTIASSQSTSKPTNSSLSNINITDSDKGKTIVLVSNQTLTVSLASTYWAIGESSNTKIIRMTGNQTITESQPCVTGGGCGTAIAHFTPITPGSATISATRNACGEAMACTGSQGQFTVTVIIVRK